MFIITQNHKEEFLGEIIDVFEDFLEAKHISIENADKDDESNPAIISGKDYDVIHDELMFMMKNWGIME